jgi:integrase
LLKWSDINFEQRTIRWRGEYQKDTLGSRGDDRYTPLSDDLARELRSAEVQGIGEAWVFPSPNDLSHPCGRMMMQTWLRLAKRRFLESIKNPDAREVTRAALRGVGFHAQKRYGVRARRHLPPKVLEALARTSFATLVAVYDHVSVEEMRAYVDANGDPRTETQHKPQAQQAN